MERPQRDLPTGTVTFLFSDIEGSTELADRLAPPVYRGLLEQHHGLLREAFDAHGGVERGTQGDSFLVVFRDAPAAVAAAVQAQQSLATGAWPADVDVRVRMGLHTGEGIPGGDDYVGSDINRAARIAAAAHGGQVLISDTTMTLSRRTLPGGVGLKDIGEHRLRGLTGTERLYQVTIAGHRSDFPPLRTRQVGAAHVPTRMTSFVGRERDLAELRELLAKNHLVTLLGPGGAGKTSLAIELARTAADDFPDGAWFVPLDAITDPGLVASTIVATLGLRDPSPRTARERLEDNLADRALLLVLDNFEQVRDAASLVGEMLAAAPSVKVVATSRSPLRLAAEQTYAVAPLPVPGSVGDDDLATVGAVPSIRLFIERARRVQSSFELTAANAEPVADICRRLDGLPLGIELAAARVGLLGPSGVRDRLASRIDLPGAALRDTPTRQRTLQATVAWSHDLLDEPSRALFARMGVFVGGCRPEELEAVCGPADELGGDPLELVSNLIDQSLVMGMDRGAGHRFEMLETIRQSALEQAALRSDQSTVRGRHALAYLAMAEAEAAELGTSRQAGAVARLAAERDNLRAAVSTSIGRGDHEVGLRFAAALARFWWLWGQMDEGRSAIDAIMAIPGAETPSLARVRALEAAGLLPYYSGDNERAIAMYRAQLDLARQVGDRQGQADAMFNLLFTADSSDDPKAGLARIDEIDQIYRGLGDERSLARTMWCRSGLLWTDGRHAEARDILERAMPRYREHDDLNYAVMAAGSLSAFGMQAGDRETSSRSFLETLKLGRVLGDAPAITIALPLMAASILELAGPVPAATILGAYEGLSKRYGVTMPPGLATAVALMGPPGGASAALDTDTYQDAFERGRGMDADEIVTYIIEMTPRSQRSGQAP